LVQQGPESHEGKITKSNGSKIINLSKLKIKWQQKLRTSQYAVWRAVVSLSWPMRVIVQDQVEGSLNFILMDKS
jgi:hypothetical protein